MNALVPPEQTSTSAATGGISRRDFLAPSRARRPLSPGQIVRRRIAVRLAKNASVLGALGLLVAIAAWPQIEGLDESARISMRAVRTDASRAGIEVMGARTEGEDRHGRPYTLEADRAVQQTGSTLVDLEAPRGTLLAGEGDSLRVTSREGRFDRDAQILELWGDVLLRRADGSTMRTERAHADLKEGAAWGDDPVAGESPLGRISSDAFRVRDQGQTVIFKGRPRATLNGASAR